jgi:hypothetical protein
VCDRSHRGIRGHVYSEGAEGSGPRSSHLGTCSVGSRPAIPMIPRLFLVFGVHIQKWPVRVDDGCRLDPRQLIGGYLLCGRWRIGIGWVGGGLTGRVADPTLFGLTCVNPPPSAGGLAGARVADPTLFGLTCVNPPPSADGLAGARVADPTLFGLICVNPPPSAVGLHALSINGCCRKEDGRG